MIELYCPFCNSKLVKTDKEVRCEHCGISVDINTASATVSENTPKYILDTLDVMRHMKEYKPIMAFSPVDLFYPKFDKTKCWYIDSKAPISGECYSVDKTPKEFIGYKGVLGYFLRRMFLNAPATNELHSISLYESTPEEMLALAMFMHNVSTEMTYDDVRTLTALCAPTWTDAMEALRNNIIHSFTDMTDSQVLYANMVCLKLNALTDNLFSNAEASLKALMLDRVKFIHDETPHELSSELLKHPRICSALFDSTVDLIANNDTWTKDNHNAYLFGTHDVVNFAGNMDAKIIKHFEINGKMFKDLWNRYGKKVSIASTRWMKKVSGSTSDDNFTIFKEYWNKMRGYLE